MAFLLGFACLKHLPKSQNRSEIPEASELSGGRMRRPECLPRLQWAFLL
jgi:hypothetical protein